MGIKSGVAWTDASWGAWRGCSKVSSGCKNCYAFRDQKRYGRDPDVVVRAADKTFCAPLGWKEQMMVFVCPWSDWFIEEADKWRDDAWAIIRQTPNLTYQILTKRPENIAGRLPEDWPLPNVWLGISAEDQVNLDARMRIFAAVPAVVKFVSIEPMLGPITFHRKGVVMPDNMLTLLDLVIVGGESGPHARKMDEWWALKVRDECRTAGVPFFFKQIGGYKKIDGEWGGNKLAGEVYHEMPDQNMAKRRYEELLEASEPLPEPEEEDTEKSLDKGETKDILE